ncbi:MAG: hypothetical protein EBZ48_16025 [Proteobacteria bacterium]|nr:hypothetical protein [Pseudomonadota bacterium]
MCDPVSVIFGHLGPPSNPSQQNQVDFPGKNSEIFLYRCLDFLYANLGGIDGLLVVLLLLARL